MRALEILGIWDLGRTKRSFLSEGVLDKMEEKTQREMSKDKLCLL